ncbi:MAG: hypothetical protein GY725_12670 [bacterium]|nr:hypothetical protein [bacterium]
MLTGRATLEVVPLAAVLVLSAVTVSCSAPHRHEWLEFLFDGVPPYVSPEARAQQIADAASEIEAQKEEELQARTRTKTFREFSHGPYAAEECARCHDLGASSGWRGPRGGGASSAQAQAALAEGGRLRMPVDELCTHCHSEYSPAHSRNQGMSIHGPVAGGWCVACHQSHTSPYPALLRAEPSAQLCGQCHLREDLLAFTAEHRPSDPNDAWPPTKEDDRTEDAPTLRVTAQCTHCHDPHGGPDHFFLRRQPATSNTVQAEVRGDRGKVQ